MIENFEIDLNVKHNWQLDNFGFTRIAPGSQCGYTSACSVLSTRIHEASEDWFVKEFTMKMDSDYISGKSNTRKGASQNNYKVIMDDYLRKYNLQYQTVVKPRGATLDDIIKALSSGSPVMASTMLTQSGHYIPITGISMKGKYLTCNDPYGAFDFKKKKYVRVTEAAGKGVKYMFDDILPYMERSTKVVFGEAATGYRVLWVS